MVLTTDSNGIQIKRYAGKVVVHKIPSTLTGDVILPPDITHIQKTSFVGCNNITSLTLQDHAKTINTGAFDHCTNLEKIIVTRDNKYFESDHKGVLFTKGREWLVYAPPKLSGLYIVPNGVKHIDKHAFKNCANMTTLMLAQTVTTIAEGAFESCAGLLHMIIPKNVTHIKPGAFVGCSQLCGVTVASDNDSFASEDGALFNKDKTELLYVPATFVGQQGKKDGRYQIPESVAYIEARAFCGCKEIKEIILPHWLADFGERPFEGCSSLETVYFSSDMLGCYDRIFEGCDNLQKRYIRDPHGVIYNLDTRKIEHVWKDIHRAFLENIVERIEDNVFTNRTHLATVTIPQSVNYIAEAAFKGCKNLTMFWVAPENESFYTDEHGVLFRKGKQNIALLRAPSNLAGNYCVPDGVTHIASYAFESCPQLAKVTIPKSVWTIRSQAFVDCPNVTICAPARSEAEKFAMSNNITFATV
jgi:hypothetical protein